jgi:DNA-binding CsgD family transcriptional regulator
LAKQSQFASVVLQPSRQRDEITRENAQRFQLILPHLTRSFSLAAHLFQTHIEEAFRQLEEKWPARAIYLLTANGRIVLTNDLGENQLDLANLIRCEFGRLNFIDTTHQQKLTSSLQICANPTTAAPCRQSLESKWAIRSNKVHAHVLPFRTTNTSSLFGHPIAALIIDEPSAQRDQNLSILRDKFVLTPAEAKLALEMCKGDGRTKAATRLGISVNTARTQLTNIFEKVGVSRQAELIAALIKAGARLD